MLSPPHTEEVKFLIVVVRFIDYYSEAFKILLNLSVSH